MGDRDHYVVALFKRVRVVLGQGQLDGHVRVLLAVAGNQWCDQHAKPAHAMQPQPPTRLEVGAAGFGGGVPHVLKNVATAQQETLARISKAQAPSGALQKSGLKVFFQFGDQPRHVCAGHVQGRSRRSKAACVDNSGEHLHAIEQVHQRCPSIAT